jgi:glucose/mannose-6-phosphate isomerase
MPGLNVGEIAQVDVSGQIADVLAMPNHLEDALWRVESASLENSLRRLEGPTPLLVCGMGGSAIGGDLAAAVLGDRLMAPLRTIRTYELPSWAMPGSYVVCVSYSGNTEETLACYEAAAALGAPRVAVTSGGRLAETARADGVPVIPLPGGLQPRHAVGYMLVAVLEIAAYIDAGPAVRTEIDAACSSLGALAREWGPEADSDSLAKRVAQRGHRTTLCIYGAGPTAPVAARWKTQVNENAKVPAFAAELPEADHNEVVGWECASELGNFLAIFLEDSDQHPRVRQRVELTANLIEPQAAGTLRLESRGSSAVERVMSLVLLGDLVSIYLAVLRGTDPKPVGAIERLQEELGARERV